MTGDELLKKLKRVAKARGVELSIVKERGKGSHGTLYFGNKFTTLPYTRREIPAGTLNAMLKQLDLTKEDLNK